MPDEKTPLDQALDLFVFAPLGLALTARDELPSLVEKGRTRVESQVTMARFVGQFAVQQGKVELEKRLKAYTEPRGPVVKAAPSTNGATAAAPTTPAAAPTPAPAAPSREVNGSGPSVVDLAIPGYDSLSASQVVQRLAGLSAADLEDVRAYETGHRGRKTVLTKIAQLQA